MTTIKQNNLLAVLLPWPPVDRGRLEVRLGAAHSWEQAPDEERRSRKGSEDEEETHARGGGQGRGQTRQTRRQRRQVVRLLISMAIWLNKKNCFLRGRLEFGWSFSYFVEKCFNSNHIIFRFHGNHIFKES